MLSFSFPHAHHIKSFHLWLFTAKAGGENEWCQGVTKNETEPNCACPVAGQSSSASTCVIGWWFISSSLPLTPPGECWMCRTLRIKIQTTCVSSRVSRGMFVVRLCFNVGVVCRLNLRELGPWAAHMRWLVWIMACVGSAYVFFFHEKYAASFLQQISPAWWRERDILVCLRIRQWKKDRTLI